MLPLVNLRRNMRTFVLTIAIFAAVFVSNLFWLVVIGLVNTEALSSAFKSAWWACPKPSSFPNADRSTHLAAASSFSASSLSASARSFISTSKSQVNEDLLTFVKVGQGQDKGGSLPVQRLPA
jgi:hypothetical protein